MTLARNSTNGKNIIKGKGALFITEDIAAGANSYTFVGNCSAFTQTVSSEVDDFYASTEAVKTLIKSFTEQVDFSGSFITQEMVAKNISKFLFGQDSIVTSGVVTVVNEVHTNLGTGSMFQLGVTLVNRIGNKNINPASIVVTNVAGTVTYVAGLDYSVDEKPGHLFIPLTSTIPASSVIHVDYATLASTYEKIESGAIPRQVALRFLSDNAGDAFGVRREIIMPNVTLSPNGDRGLIGDDVMELGFDLKILPGLNGERAITEIIL